MIRTTIEGMEYGGSASKYYWNPALNPNINVNNGLPNCTTFAYSCILESGQKAPVISIKSAGEWHKYLTNGWKAVPYEEYKKNIKVGDIIEWSRGNHVAVVSSISKGIWISGSFYTGIHGKSYYDGSYDTREGINNLKELSDYFYKDYQYRFFHFCPLETENQWCNATPDYVLVAPNVINPVDRDETKDQVYIGVNNLRVRTNSNIESDVVGMATVGYYNADKVVGGTWEDRGTTDNIWYRVGAYYMAGVDGVSYFPVEKSDPAKQIELLVSQLVDQVDVLTRENIMLKDKLHRIEGIANE